MVWRWPWQNCDAAWIHDWRGSLAWSSNFKSWCQWKWWNKECGRVKKCLSKDERLGVCWRPAKTGDCMDRHQRRWHLVAKRFSANTNWIVFNYSGGCGEKILLNIRKEVVNYNATEAGVMTLWWGKCLKLSKDTRRAVMRKVQQWAYWWFQLPVSFHTRINPGHGEDLASFPNQQNSPDSADNTSDLHRGIYATLHC